MLDSRALHAIEETSYVAQQRMTQFRRKQGESPFGFPPTKNFKFTQ